MGMPVVVAIDDAGATPDDAAAVFTLLRETDARFSTYKEDSEISRINRGEIDSAAASPQMQEVFRACDDMARATDGAFDMHRPDGTLDPSGLVKGWAIARAAVLLRERGLQHFFVDVGGDVAAVGGKTDGSLWRIGIRDPGGPPDAVLAVVAVRTAGVATSGAYVRGAHIYDPREPERSLDELASVTVIGPDVCEADCFATAAFVRGRDAAAFIAARPGLDAYVILPDGTVDMTPGMQQYLVSAV